MTQLPLTTSEAAHPVDGVGTPPRIRRRKTDVGRRGASELLRDQAAAKARELHPKAEVRVNVHHQDGPIVECWTDHGAHLYRYVGYEL